MTLEDKNFFMRLALLEAQKAFERGEIPVGALVVQENKILARGYNLTEALQDVTAHAEMIALSAAANTLNFKYLAGASIFVTLEPCLMCAGALAWSQVSALYFGAADEKRGFVRLGEGTVFPKKVKIEGGILAQECQDLLRTFFEKLRK
ncbi:nucleoside deaminase [Hugenholtzia roseola]|uniref:nucleoside deaminase n=1 Tax=Hugenholtzia roseola TaxID=1002 RepID=UPI0003FE155D|nr:nucleoside deaminase [Hugenholtzia roseola]